MSKLETVDLRDPFGAQKTWGDAKEGELVILSTRDFDLNEEYEDLIYKQFEDPAVGILCTDHAVKKHDSLINNYVNINSINLEIPFIIRKINIELSDDKGMLLSLFKRSGFKFQHLAEPVFNVS